MDTPRCGERLEANQKLGPPEVAREDKCANHGPALLVNRLEKGMLTTALALAYQEMPFLSRHFSSETAACAHKGTWYPTRRERLMCESSIPPLLTANEAEVIML